MIKFFLIFCFIIVNSSLFNCCRSQLEIYESSSVDTLPHFPGGEDSLIEFINRNLKWPSSDFGGAGTVIVSFIVEPSGLLTNIKVEKELCDFCDIEAVNLIRSMPKWIPGKINNNKVRVLLKLPVRYKILE